MLRSILLGGADGEKRPDHREVPQFELAQTVSSFSSTPAPTGRAFHPVVRNIPRDAFEDGHAASGDRSLAALMSFQQAQGEPALPAAIMDDFDEGSLLMPDVAS
jgi:hypothetical protein